MSQLIIDLLRAPRRAGRRQIAIFDIDATLFNSAARSLKIVEEFAEQEPMIRPYFEQLRLEAMGYKLRDSLAKVGCTDPALLKTLDAFWSTRFFSGPYLKYDTPYPGAARLVQETMESGLLIYYLTGRDTPNMREGTLKALEQNGFPTKKTRLNTKESWDVSDLDHKMGAIEELRSLGEVILAVENEPANANLLAEAFPSATVALHETFCAPDPPPLLPEVVRLPNLQFEWKK